MRYIKWMLLVGLLASAHFALAQTTIIRPTAVQVEDNTPYAFCADTQLAYDDNLNTYASCTTSVPTGPDAQTELAIWSGFGSGISNPNSVTLKATSAFSFTGFRNSGHAYYSTDCGTSWITIWQATQTNRVLQTDSITLPTSVNLACLRVRFNIASSVSGYDSATCTVKVNEIWVEEQ